jgi:hypothetical protein
VNGVVLSSPGDGAAALLLFAFVLVVVLLLSGDDDLPGPRVCYALPFAGHGGSDSPAPLT